MFNGCLFYLISPSARHHCSIISMAPASCFCSESVSAAAIAAAVARAGGRWAVGGCDCSNGGRRARRCRQAAATAAAAAALALTWRGREREWRLWQSAAGWPSPQLAGWSRWQVSPCCCAAVPTEPSRWSQTVCLLVRQKFFLG